MYILRIDRDDDGRSTRSPARWIRLVAASKSTDIEKEGDE
jgi:hypothetical protein